MKAAEEFFGGKQSAEAEIKKYQFYSGMYIEH